MKAIYKKLLKIKKPVLIEVRPLGSLSLNRYRILYPDGQCEYSYITGCYTEFNRSCFQESTLEATVKGMESYDVKLGIAKIQEIK